MFQKCKRKSVQLYISNYLGTQDLIDVVERVKQQIIHLIPSSSAPCEGIHNLSQHEISSLPASLQAMNIIGVYVHPVRFIKPKASNIHGVDSTLHSQLI